MYFDRLSEALRDVARMREALDSGGPGAEDQLSTTALREKLEKFLRDIQQVWQLHTNLCSLLECFRVVSGRAVGA